MERKRKVNKASAILTADWHLREDQPICRTDDFQAAQWKKVDFIRKLQKKHECPVIHAGDLFHHWKPSPYLLSKTIEHLPDNFYSVYGNHDLPQHNIELAEKSGLHTLEKSGMVKVIETHWKGIPERPSLVFPKIDKNIIVWHVMTYDVTKPFPGCEDPPARKLLRKLDGNTSLVVTGHNHKPFTVKDGGKILVNPGAITRQEADEDHEPRVFLWYQQQDDVKAVFLPFNEGVISRRHLEVKEQRDARIEAFVQRLDAEWDAGVSFEDNIRRFIEANKLREPTIQIILKAIDK